jgi:cation transport ATPase
VVKDSRSFETVAQVETVIFDFALAPRADFRETLIGLRQRNNCAIFLLADHPVPGAAHLADKLGVDGVWGVSSPAECVKLVRQWQQAGKMVCYIGTGGADGELLTCADLSISLRPLVALADDPAQVQLIQDCLPQVLRLFDLGQQFALMRRRAVGLTFWPGALSMGGTLLLGVGLLPAVLLNNVGLMVGVEDLTALWGSPQPLAKSQSHDWWQGWSNCVWPRAGNPLAVA